MKVLVADKFEKSGIAGLEAAGCEVVYEPDLKDDALLYAIRDRGADVLVVRGTNVTAPMLDAGRLALIVRAGAGYNTIDVAAASKRGATSPGWTPPTINTSRSPTAALLLTWQATG